MRLIALALTAACLSGCSTLGNSDPSALLEALEKYDADCYKEITGSIVGGTIAVGGSVSLQYKKVCNPQVAPPTISPGGVP